MVLDVSQSAELKIQTDYWLIFNKLFFLVWVFDSALRERSSIANFHKIHSLSDGENYYLFDVLQIFLDSFGDLRAFGMQITAVSVFSPPCFPEDTLLR